MLWELDGQKVIRGVYSERQFLEVMTDFWMNHFNIFLSKVADRCMTTDFEMNVIRPHAMGKFKDFLMATANSPAMLFYLDNFLSSSPDANLPEMRRFNQRNTNQTTKREPGINENYARERMELRTIGVDGGYTQQD